MDRDACYERRRQVGESLLGPALLAFCHRLWLQTTALENGDACLLFFSRGGLRLRFLYEKYLAIQGLESPCPLASLMVSRIAVARACYVRAPEMARCEFWRWFRGSTGRDAARCLLPCALEPEAEARIAALPPTILDAPLTEAALQEMLQNDGAFGRTMAQIFAAQCAWFEEYVERVAGARRRLLGCDTGLYMSTLALLRAATPGADWIGLVFGKSNHRGSDPPHWPQVAGLIFDAKYPDVRKPETCYLRHWHLLESALEPAMPSASYYVCDGIRGRARSNIDDFADAATIGAGDNPFFAGICDHFAALSPPLDPCLLESRFQAAARELQQRLCFPSPADAELLDPGRREIRWNHETSLQRRDACGRTPRARLRAVRSSFWPEGQAPLLFPRLHRPLQYLLVHAPRIRQLGRRWTPWTGTTNGSRNGPWRRWVARATTTAAAVCRRVENHWLRGGCRLLSIDLFDTLLLRRDAAEPRRFEEIAVRWQRRLKRQFALCVAPQTLRDARIRATRIAEAAERALRGEPTASIERILAILVAELRLPAEAPLALLQEEQAYEVAAVAPHAPLVALCRSAAAAGIRVVLTSDMYLTAECINQILAAHGLNDLARAVYVSSEWGATKSTGRLFAVLATQEACAPGQIIHVGDNWDSDYLAARAGGIAAFWLPRPRARWTGRDT